MISNIDIHLCKTRHGMWFARVTMANRPPDYTLSMKTRVGALVLAAEIIDRVLGSEVVSG